MYCLVVNAGSSSVKFTLFGIPDLSPEASGWIERIGMKNSRLVLQYAGKKTVDPDCRVESTRKAVFRIIDLLTGPDSLMGIAPEEIRAVGHRVVHGGNVIEAPVVINRAVRRVIRDFSPLAPLHNPPGLEGILACEKRLGHAVQTAVFDTAFHTTLPPHAALYGLPPSMANDLNIRRYGFHGTSHLYVCRTAAELLGLPLERARIVSCHLGNGSSITAVDQGKSVDTTMGFTPLEGLIMGTRSGDIDPSVLFYLVEEKGWTLEQAKDLLNRESGLYGMAGIQSSDMRDILSAADQGNADACLAVDAFVYRIRKTIGAFAAVLGGLDILAFTGGIGENAWQIREHVCRGFTGNNCPGVFLDPVLNQRLSGRLAQVHRPESPAAVVIVPADEQKEIAVQTLALLHKTRTPF